MPLPVTFRLPDLSSIFSIFPDLGINSHYECTYPESREWIAQYHTGVYGPKMRDFMERGKIELLGAYTYPYASKERLRFVMDLHNVSWLFDESSDVKTGQQAGVTAVVFRRALIDPEFNDGSWLCHMLKDFRQRHLDNVMSHAFVEMFIRDFIGYADGMSAEACYRDLNKVLDIAGYVKLRREAGAVRLALHSVEYCLEKELPSYVREDPAFVIAYNGALDLGYIVNDIHSYNMEQSKGHGHHAANIVTVFMEAQNIGLQAAMDYAGGFCHGLVLQILEAKELLAARSDPVFSNDAVKVIEGCINFFKGQDIWDFESERFFGKSKDAVRKTKVVNLRALFEDSVNLNE
uniref:Putative sesquiterpene synthase n=1 Tax=Clitopilus sp. TaxID=1967123 RepID=A0A4P2VIC1_9AGAR|nr:putative sesquiterpene synthase [Clitopilus sp.]